MNFLKSKLKNLFLGFCPPIFLRIFLKILKSPHKSKFNVFRPSTKFDSQKSYKDAYFKIGAQNRLKPFVIDVERLYYFGGLKYSSSKHPFRIFYTRGLNAFRNFYSSHQPRDIMERHFLTYHGYKLQGVDLPWFEVSDKPYLEGENGLSISEGSQHYGPITEKKLRLEARRLTKLKNSIAKYGYLAHRDGFPRVYILEDGKKYSAVVVGGQHRVATMVELGFKKIPVIFSGSYPPIVSSADVDNWPYVKNNILEKVHALKIFYSYFDE